MFVNVINSLYVSDWTVDNDNSTTVSPEINQFQNSIPQMYPTNASAQQVENNFLSKLSKNILFKCSNRHAKTLRLFESFIQFKYLVTNGKR